MSIAQTFLTQDEQDTLVRCVQEVEKTTSGEIVPIIADASYEYPRASLIGGILGGGLAGIGAALAFGREDMWFFLAVFLAAFLVLSRLLEAFPRLKKPFISQREMREEVEEAAFTAFYRHGLHRTRDLTGILVYVSVYERQVQVLADKGINDKVDPQVWREVVNMVTDGIRAGTTGQALCKGVKRCGELVTEKFPIKEDDTDELPNLIIDG